MTALNNKQCQNNFPLRVLPINLPSCKHIINISHLTYMLSRYGLFVVALMYSMPLHRRHFQIESPESYDEPCYSDLPMTHPVDVLPLLVWRSVLSLH